MSRKKNISGRNGERGVVIMLVAVLMLFVVGAMAALSIDVVTIYTARSEAQLAADAAALAGARVLANSGMTSETSGGLNSAAETLASTVATQVAANNVVGGRTLSPIGVSPCTVGQEICVSFNDGAPTFGNNPQVSVRVQRTDLPTFFARIWGSTQATVRAAATAEAYNPSGGAGASFSSTPPVAPSCVKPWLLPNLDPSLGGGAIFNSANGAITNPSLLGWSSGTTLLQAACTSCTTTPPLPGLQPWKFYPGDQGPASFPPPTQALPTCSLIPTPTAYQTSIAGCIQAPISCNSTVNIDTNLYAGDRNADAADAVNCLTHATAAGGGDTVTSAAPPSAPFQFFAGVNNPIAPLVNHYVMVSDSLVTVPVFDAAMFSTSASNVQIIGFVQLFLNSDGFAAQDSGPANGQIRTTVINMAGCGTNSLGTPIPPILGNGASPVAVRLISP